MAKKIGTVGKVYVDQYDLSPSTAKIDKGGAIQIADVTAFGATARAKIAGQKDGMVDLRGFWDDAALDTVNGTTGIDAALAAVFGTAKVVSFYPAGDAPLAPGFGGRAELNENYHINSPVDGAAALSAQWTASGGLDDIISLQAKTQITLNGANQFSASIDDNGGASNNGFIVIYHIVAIDAATTITTLALQDSADNTTFATVAASASGLTGVGASRIAVAAGAGVPRRYVRLVINGTSTKKITLQVGFQRL